MSDDTSTGGSDRIRILAVSPRRMGAASDRGCNIAVKFIQEGEAGEQVEWLDNFFDEHCPGISAGESGFKRSLHTGNEHDAPPD